MNLLSKEKIMADQTRQSIESKIVARAKKVKVYFKLLLVKSFIT